MSNPLPLTAPTLYPNGHQAPKRGRGLTPSGRGWVDTWVDTCILQIRLTYGVYGVSGRGCRYFFQNFAHTRKTVKTRIEQTMEQPSTPSTPLGSERGRGRRAR